MKKTIQIDWEPIATPLDVITTSTGYFKAGLKGKIIGGGEREIFVGKEAQRVVIPEFTLELDNGQKREFCQYGRDFRFACQ